MEALALLARLALAAVFVVSAVAKLRDQAGARAAVKGFGVPGALVPAVAVALAPLELLSALLLLTYGWGVTAGALLAGLMLAAFTVAITVNLVRGNRVECHCFGALSTKPVSWWSVGRNVALLVLVGLVLGGGTAQPWPWQAVADLFAPLSVAERWLWAAVLALAAAVAVLGVLFGSLLRRYGHVLLRLEALESAGHLGHAHGHAVDFAPHPLPALEVVDSAEASLRLGELVAADRTTLLVFVSPWCEACGELVDDLLAWQADDSGPAVVVLSPGEREAIAAKFGEVVVHVSDGGATDALGLEYTPGALVVSASGLVASPPSYGSEDVRRLYLAAAGRVPPADLVIGPPPVREGDPIPHVLVEPVDGPDDALPLADAVARTVGTDDAVLLFWETTCGFCQQITGDIARRVDSVPMLVVLRDEDLPALRASGITAPVVLDPAFAAGNAVQAPGTPCAVRVRDGALASTVAVGGPEVLDLLAAVRISP